MKKALFLNRRCIKHPETGGAEIYTFELAKALTGQGYEVEWFSSRAAGLKNTEEIENIKFVRKGNELTTHFYGLLYAMNKRDWLLVDEFNGIGFFTFPLKNAIILIHQMYNEFWTAELGSVGYPLKLLERLLLHLYRKKPSITVSYSTFEDLEQVGFKNVTIIHNGVDIKPLDHIPKKESSLTLIYLGRLKKTKNPEDAIRAFCLIKKKVEDAKLWIVGDGPLYPRLKERHGKEEGISFFGFLDNKEKYEHLKKAHFLLVPSIREGWGQAVIQANAMGTPAIGYNVSGLRDSIKNGQTGILANGCNDIASAALDYWENRQQYLRLCRQALEWSKTFSWEKTRREFVKYIERLT